VIVLVMLAGAAGAVARFLVDSEVKRRRPSAFPWGTVLINVSGSLLIGLVAGAVIFHGQPSAWQTIIGTGFCGGYTTFSTASIETVRLVQQRRHWLALGNAVVPLALSVGACALGLFSAYLD
jgi:CrcB protein